MQPTTPLRLRLSLWVRTLIALAVVLTVTLAVALVVSLFGGIGVTLILGQLITAVESFSTAPRLSAMLPVPAVAVGAVALGGLVLLVYGFLSDAFSDRYPEILFAHGLVVCLYLAATETSVVLTELLSSPSPAVSGIGVAFVFMFGGVVAVWTTVTGARRELGRLREQLVDASEPAVEQQPALAETVAQLAHQVDIPSPTLRITDTDRPESFALGSGDDAVIVVSTGLLAVLSEDEATAVVAHEVSHLANADNHIMGLVLTPVLMADNMVLTDTDNPNPISYVHNAVFGILKLYGQLGVAVLSRGREWHADAGAVALTGSPAALAAALTKLTEQRETPTTDLRQWEQSAGALDILPPADQYQATGPFRTHPATAARIERLRQQVVDAEKQ